MLWLDSLKRMKAASGKTTRQIATESGIPEPTLEKLFAGTTKDPKLETIRAVVYCLGFTLNDLDPDIKKEAQNVSSSEPPISVESLADLLESAGIIEPGQDLSDADLEFLLSVIAIISRWFSRK